MENWPLTSADCSLVAKRLRAIRSEKVSLMTDAARAAYCMDIMALQLEDIEAAQTAPAWSGEQPAEDSTTEQENR